MNKYLEFNYSEKWIKYFSENKHLNADDYLMHKYFHEDVSSKDFSKIYDPHGFIKSIDLVEEMFEKLNSKIGGFTILDKYEDDFYKDPSNLFERIYYKDITNGKIHIKTYYSQTCSYSSDYLYDYRFIKFYGDIDSENCVNEEDNECIFFMYKYFGGEEKAANKTIKKIFNYVIDNMDHLNQLIDDKKKMVDEYNECVRRSQYLKDSIKKLNKTSRHVLKNKGSN